MTYDPQSSAGPAAGGTGAFIGATGNGGGASRWSVGGKPWSRGGLGGVGGSVSNVAVGAKDQLLDGFGRMVDALENNIHRAPADIQPAARKGVAFARERPLATMAGLAALALVLARGARRR